MTADRDTADRWYDDHVTEILDRLREVQAEVLRKRRREAATLSDEAWARISSVVQEELVWSIDQESGNV